VAAANPVDSRLDGRVDGPVGSPRRVATWAAAGVAVLLAVSGVLGAIGSVSADATPSPRVWVVREGDTLWGIAASLQPRGDVRPLVSQLVQLNGTSAVHAGDSIMVPRSHR